MQWVHDLAINFSPSNFHNTKLSSLYFVPWMTIHLVLWRIKENQHSHNLHTLYTYLKWHHRTQNLLTLQVIWRIREHIAHVSLMMLSNSFGNVFKIADHFVICLKYRCLASYLIHHIWRSGPHLCADCIYKIITYTINNLWVTISVLHKLK